MTIKTKCIRTVCPLCKGRCQAGSTDSGFIENNGACLQCLFSKTQAEVNALLLAKNKNDDLKAGASLPIKNFDLSNTKDKGVIAVVTIDKKNCIENIDVAELNSTEIDNSYDCAACQHRKNSDEMKVKSPAIFEGYEVNSIFIRNENAYICDGGYAEEVTIKRTWQKPDGSAWVTFLSNMRRGFLDMQLADFAKKYKAKPADAAVPISTDDTPLSKSKRYFEGIKTSEVVGGTPASDGKRYFYITFSYFIGGKRGHRKGFISHRTFNNEMFNIQIINKEIKSALLVDKIKSKNILIEHWQEVSRNEYIQLLTSSPT